MAFDKNKHIAFEGRAFRIEWYVDAAGRCQVLELAEQMPKERIAKLAQLFKLMGETGIIRNKGKFRHEGDQIYAFKPQPYRYLCFFTQGRRIVITNGFCKKADRLPETEKSKAMERREDYLKRVGSGDYYG